MYYNKFDSYYYSRPISYRSYNTRVSSKEILDTPDHQTAQVIDLLRRNNQQVNDLGGLGRGVRFGDFQVGRRVYNHNAGLYYANCDYYIHQWKNTNDLAKEHPTGNHYTTKVFSELVRQVQKVLDSQNIRLK